MTIKGWEYWWESDYGTLDAHQESPVTRSGVWNGLLQADLYKTKHSLERSEWRKIRVVNIACMHSSPVWPLNGKCFCWSTYFPKEWGKVPRLRVSAGKSQTGNNKILKNMCSWQIEFQTNVVPIQGDIWLTKETENLNQGYC